MSGNKQSSSTTVVSHPKVKESAAARMIFPPGTQLKSAFPARASEITWAATCLNHTAVIERVFAAPFRIASPRSQRQRETGVLAVLGWLAAFPGNTWQQRWESSGAETADDWRDLFDREIINEPPEENPVPRLSIGLLVLVCADIIRPTMRWFLHFAPARKSLTREMARTRDAEVFTAMEHACTSEQVGMLATQRAMIQISVIMAAKGGRVSDIEVGDCVELAEITSSMPMDSHGSARSPLFYQLLLKLEVLGQEAPAALAMFSSRGQPTCEELIDRYNISCKPVRDLLVDYLRERQVAMDFSTLQRTAYLIGKLFWADLESHHPGIDSLKLPADVSVSWKKRVMSRTFTSTAANGARIQKTLERLDARSVFSAVRVFYLDLVEWAEDDPARWGPWAVRCPVNAMDLSHKKSRLARKSRTDQRTRERLPVLPALVSWVQSERDRTVESLAAAQLTEPGGLFTVEGHALRRSVTKVPGGARIWAEPPDGGKRIDLMFEEHRGFWTWAMVEVLRHTGIRIEELTELSHHSLIQYQLPDTGALIPCYRSLRPRLMQNGCW